MYRADAPQVEKLVYVVEADGHVRGRVVEHLRAAGYTAVGCGSAAELFPVIDRGRPGCVLLDMGLPDMSGLDVLEELKRISVDLAVILTSAQPVIPAIARGFKQGAKDFLEKPCDEAQLLASVDRAVAGCMKNHHKRQHCAHLVAQLAALTDRERQVLRRVLDGDTSRMIGEQMNLSQKTIEACRATLMKKLDASSLAELVRKVVSVELHLNAHELPAPYARSSTSPPC